MKVRTVASGVAIAALAGTAVPLALSGSASAKVPATPTTTAAPTMTITKCSPATATISTAKKTHYVTIHGTELAGATGVKIDGKTAVFTTNTNKYIKAAVPTGIKAATDTVKVSVGSVSATNSTSCTFKKAVKKSKK